MVSEVRKGSAKRKVSKTNPVLQKAAKALTMYARATGAMVSVHDENYLPIPENMCSITSDRSMCMHCTKYRAKTHIKTPGDFRLNPCRELHINGMKKSDQLEGSYIYMCELGFVFWVSPVYSEDKFIGALLGAGVLGENNIQEDARLALMNGMPENEFKKLISSFPRGDIKKIRALAEMLLLCAKSVSRKSSVYFDTLKRRTEQQEALQKKMDEFRNNSGVKIQPYPLDKEKKLLACLRNGNRGNALAVLNEFLAELSLGNSGNYRFIQLQASELVVVLSRSDINTGLNEQSLLEISTNYIRKIQEAEDMNALTDTMYSIIEEMASRIFSFQGVQHVSALKRAEQYIRENYTRKISLREIAGVSGLSAPYFSTIFKEEMGENFSSYLNRLRVEKAGKLLLETDLSLCDISCNCGFEDQSWFSKIFKAYTGSSPGKYRQQGGISLSEITEENLSEGVIRQLADENPALSPD
ncbi:MAG: helix-turn-helix domain-containing protein [Treponema sp.]|jgi:AraC-like DNA-binding protein/ligand-binding sensor protein|nr:helix-turn-helix domain-containing protein [Treponema sp.]